MFKNVKNYLYTFWLGGSLAYADLTISNYKYWIIIVPTIVLVSFLNERK